MAGLAVLFVWRATSTPSPKEARRPAWRFSSVPSTPPSTSPWWAPPKTMVRWVAASRPGAKTRVLSPVRSKFDVRAIAEHVRAVRELRPDILHVNLDNPWTSQYGMLAGAVTRTPDGGRAARPLRQPWRTTPAVARPTRRPSGQGLRLCVTRLGAPRRADAAHEAGIDARHPQRHAGARAACPRRRRRAPRARSASGRSGGLSPEKGLDVLIEAMASSPGAISSWWATAPSGPRSRRWSTSSGSSTGSEFAGWIDPPWTATWAFDVLAMPSFTEGFPLVIVEAMLAAIPVVASRVGGIPEIVVEGADRPARGAARRHRPRPRAAAHRRRIPSSASQMAARCRAVALEQFTDPAMAASFEALYRELARAGRRAGQPEDVLVESVEHRRVNVDVELPGEESARVDELSRDRPSRTRRGARRTELKRMWWSSSWRTWRRGSLHTIVAVADSSGITVRE